LFKQQPSVIFDMVEVQNARALPASQQFLEHRFSLDKWQSPQVLSIQKQQIERDEHALTPAEQQISEQWTATFIDTRDLAIEHCTFNAKMFSDPVGKIREPAKRVSVSGDQFALAVFDVSKRSKAVHLQFIKELVRIERLRTA
jgi:hypothetical protein